MSTAILPSFAGLGFDSTRTPVWDTVIQQSVSGKETRFARSLYPRWQWELTYNVLRSGSAYNELQQLAGFFNLRSGMMDTFLYKDADDCSVTAQPVGTGDGTTKNFQLIRSFGGFVEPILAPDTASAIRIYVGGVLQGSGYSVTPWATGNAAGPGIVVFTAATVNLGSVPQNNLTITGTTGIAAFSGLAAGQTKFITFAASLSLTHNAISLILTGGANYTTSTDDQAIVTCMSGSNYRVTLIPSSGRAVVSSSSVLRNYISGFVPTSQSFASNVSASMTITAGQAADSGNALMLSGGAFTWNIANGNAANGYQGGTTVPSSSTLHFYVIATSSGGSAASFASTSLTPTLPSGYAGGVYRRVFSLNSNASGVILPGTAYEIEGGGLQYWFGSEYQDVNVSTLGTTRTLYTLTGPNGVRFHPIIRVGNTTSQGVIFSSPDEVDVAPINTSSSANTASYDLIVGSSATASLRIANLVTNTSAQVGARSTGASTTIGILNRGFIDFRRA